MTNSLFHPIWELDRPPLLPGQKHGRVHAGLADLSLVDYLLPSEQECSEYWGDDVQPQEAVMKFFNLGARGVTFFLGRDAKPVHISVYPVQVVDVTGVGDPFWGGFMFSLAETGDPVQAACYGAVSEFLHQPGDHFFCFARLCV